MSTQPSAGEQIDSILLDFASNFQFTSAEIAASVKPADFNKQVRADLDVARPLLQKLLVGAKLNELEHAKRNGYIAGNLMHKVDRRIAELTKQLEGDE
ncbi:hypothetical protein [Mycolicibacterium neoaurum]|uniref:hypothetical protein n=1 Tax=Mycolicibacterium neoaurum TaxID=1795 RepID=UPI001F4CF9A8|nr:hypothetical protein [Mycolicibacterium neoaurum]